MDDRYTNLSNNVLDGIGDDQVYESKLKVKLIQEYPNTSSDEIYKCLTYLENHEKIFLTQVQYYVLTDHFESKRSIRITINKLKRVEVVQKIVDKLKPKRKTSQVAYVISKNLPLSGADIAKELQRQSSAVYLNLQYLEKIGVIRNIGIGYKRSKLYKITYYGKYAIRSLELRNYFKNKDNN